MASKTDTSPAQVTQNGVRTADQRAALEKKLGILHYTSPVDFGWTGEIRKRYTDFIVHEVQKDGSVVYLSDRDGNVESQPREEPKAEDVVDQTEATEATEPTEPTPTESAQPVVPEIAESEIAFLAELVGGEVAAQLQAAHALIFSGGDEKPGKLTIASNVDRPVRGRYHEAVRRVFQGAFETRADGETGDIVAMPAAGAGKARQGRGGRDRNSNRNSNRDSNRDQARRDPKAKQRTVGSSGIGGNSADRTDRSAGKYLHFTMFKENKDTMEAVSYLGRLLKVRPSYFGFAGTKDRRAATTQRVSVLYHGPNNVSWVNARSKFVKVGDFARASAGLQLGQHGGNDFVIVVKDVALVRAQGCSLAHRLRMTEACVQAAMDHVQQRGFLNYFGLQRFGTRSIGTQEIGQKILGLDFRGACEAILAIEPETAAALAQPDPEALLPPDELHRARAIQLFHTTGDAAKALKLLPRRFSAETTLVEHLGRPTQGPGKDYCGALCRIARGLRVLYIHAYQSLVWNWVASERWARHGDRVIAGDLVLVHAETGPSVDDADADAGVGDGIGVGVGDGDGEQYYQQARALSAAEAASGAYTILDIVLPVPGFDVVYPDNDIGAFYAEFMGRPEHGGLSPYEMRRPQKEFSLSGHYRKLMARFTATPQFFVRPYAHDHEQMHPTDVDDIIEANRGKAAQAQAQTDADSAVPLAPLARRRRISQVEDAQEDDAKRVKTDEPVEPAAGEPMVVDGAPAAPPATADAGENKYITNLFKTMPTEGVSSTTAINRTAAWRSAFPAFEEREDMQIAVALNFRMSSSNYATMCLREMMASFGA